MARAQKRKNYLVNRRFQLKYTLLLVGILLITMLSGGAALYMGMMGSIVTNFSKVKVAEDLEAARRARTFEDSQLKPSTYSLLNTFREASSLSDRQRQVLESALKDINRDLLPKVLILSLILIVAGIYISHRIAGPMYKVEESAKAIRQGNLNTSFKLRKSDEMQEVASALNDMAKSLHEDVKKIKEVSAALDAKVNKIAGQLPEEDVNGIRKLIGETSSILSKYST